MEYVHKEVSKLIIEFTETDISAFMQRHTM